MSRRVLAAAALVGTAALLLAAAPPDDPLVPQQGHLRTVRAFEAWDVRRGDGIVVAVVDTGVDLDHPDLEGRLVEGVDLVDPETPPDDPQGHGTLVAGVIAAVTGNGRGVAGAAPEALVMPVRVLDEEGRGTSDLVAAGIRHAVANGARIVNLSLAEVGEDAGQGPLGLGVLVDRRVEEAIREAREAGVLVVAAAGNEARDEVPYDADTAALVVGATDAEDRRWARSNADARTLFAPGVDILSTWHEGRYAKADGTSFAAPVVSAGAALLMGAELDAAAADERLRATAVTTQDDLPRVDLAAAVEGLPPTPTTPQPGPAPQPPPAPAPAPAPQPPPAPPPPPPGDDAPDAVGPVEVVEPPTADPPPATTAPPTAGASPPALVAPPPPLPEAPVVGLESAEPVAAEPTAPTAPPAEPLVVVEAAPAAGAGASGPLRWVAASLVATACAAIVVGARRRR